MLRTCFVARIVGEQTKSVEIFSRFEPDFNGQAKLADLPSAQNLGTFCYPIGPANVKPKEYGAPEVRSQITPVSCFGRSLALNVDRSITHQRCISTDLLDLCQP